ncbi:hypothetical protein PILCRDRAFT_12290 [Piloderma croceum F 1598]|uniref:Glucose-methanol-choline oxidoreductase C-terminal domain-containing protein n=1 Tax=Piloderma croceum (strain F 1598) TaxID=765440 RepID=A0A0C3BIF7_PILCF|nr:hypothetical protein PILCRDRAFT_12290 [Piloderma croceum F 1598]
MPTAFGTDDPSHGHKHPQKFPRLSKPVEWLSPSYGILVIGSGYGGGVAASRLARVGSLFVFSNEEWKDGVPGEYPSTLSEVSPNFHVQGKLTTGNIEGKYVETGDPLGLFRLLLGDSQNVFVGNDYERAASMLEPSPYPLSYPKLAKLDILQTQAAVLGWEDRFYRPPQTTRFKDGPNSTGVMMRASTGSGMDSTGVNDGSKSSTLINYLSDAWNWGVEILCEVRFIKKAPKGDGYIVFFAWHGSNRRVSRNTFEQSLMWVHAKRCVFLAAGTLGTTEIFAFGYNTDYEVNSMARTHPDSASPVGPTITGIIDCRDQGNPLEGFVIEEGAVPEALVSGIQVLLEGMPGKVFPRQWDLTHRLRHLMSGLRSRMFGPYSSGRSVQRTQVYLIMSHDSNQAYLTLNESGRPVLQFFGVGASKHVAYLNEVLAKATNEVGGTYINNPFFAALGEREITVHPIGGANMRFGKEYHHGLVCVDASVIPTALGVSPLATITALAEDSVEHVAAKIGIEIDYETTNGLLDLFGPPAKTLSLTPDLKEAIEIIEDAKRSDNASTEFTEVMEGFIHVGGEIEDFAVAEGAAIGASSSARFFLSVHGWDTGTSTYRADHHPFMVLRGTFQLFNDDHRTPGTKNICYDFDMISTDGEMFHFHGYKVIDSSIAFAPWRTWKAVSTLYVTITHLKDNSIAGRGVLRIVATNIGNELASSSTTGSTLILRARAAGRFLSYFALQMAKFFFAPFTSLVWPDVLVAEDMHKISPAEIIQIVACDGVKTRMWIWTPVIFKDTTQLPSDVPILFVPGAAVDHNIFATPTIKVNAIEYFTTSGATCFCVTLRVGKTAVAKAGWTTYDARFEVAAALNHITSLYPQGTKAYVVAHCIGSLALSMGLLDGTIPAGSVKGITASNVFMGERAADVVWVSVREHLMRVCGDGESGVGLTS